jgi:RNA polymerase sigma factor (sigma-70 family)
MPHVFVSHAAWIDAALTRYEGPLLRYATRFTGDPERARDVVQDTFLKLCTADRRKVEERLAAWLYTVCRNRALDVRSKEGRMGSLHAVHEEGVANGGSGPEARVAQGEVQRVVVAALETLPAEQQEAFCLKFQDQLSYREIGEVMGVSLGTVSNLITAALGELRTQLRAGGHLAQEG